MIRAHHKRGAAWLRWAVIAIASASVPIASADDLTELLGDLDSASSEPEPRADDSDTSADSAERVEVITLDDEPPKFEPKPKPKRSVVLEEIVVTAQKRQQSLSDVPVSVTALSGDRLADSGIEDLSDLSEYTPNFKMVEGGFIPAVYMRGVGSGSNQGLELSVGIFSDGIHLGRPHQTRAAFMDVERIEVLRGPQPILFGKNTIAGALNVISARPGDSLEYAVKAVRGLDADSDEFSGFVSMPLGQDFGVRLAGRLRGEEGYQFNEFRQRNEPGLDERSLRLTVDFDGIEDLSSSLKLEQSRRKQSGRNFEFTHSSALTDCSGENTQLDRRKSTDYREGGDIENYNATLNLEYPIFAGTLNSVTAVSGYDSHDFFDADSSSFDTLGIPGFENYDQVSQEFRFSSFGGGFVDYVAGVFFQKSELLFQEAAPIRVRAGAVERTGVCAVDTALVVEAGIGRDFVLDSSALSAFVQFTLNWSATLRSTLGVRFVREEKSAIRDFRVSEVDGSPALPTTTAVLNALNINAHYLDGEREVNQTLPSVNLQWDTTDDIMSYISFTVGAKSGSYDARGNNDQDTPTGGGRNFEFDDEVANAWELGAKMRLLEGKADLNVALYDVTYDDMQVSVYDGTSAFIVTNAGRAKTRGLELDGRWLVNEHVLLSASAAYLDFEWLDYAQGPCYVGREDRNEDDSCDLTGQTNLQAPRWTGSLSSTFTTTSFGDTIMAFTLDTNFKDRHFTSGDLDPRGVQDAIVKYNAQLALSDAAGTWRLALVGRNLSDETTLGISAASLLDVGGYRATVEPGRTVFLELGYRFE